MLPQLDNRKNKWFASPQPLMWQVQNTHYEGVRGRESPLTHTQARACIEWGGKWPKLSKVFFPLFFLWQHTVVCDDVIGTYNIRALTTSHNAFHLAGQLLLVYISHFYRVSWLGWNWGWDGKGKELGDITRRPCELDIDKASNFHRMFKTSMRSSGKLKHINGLAEAQKTLGK